MHRNFSCRNLLRDGRIRTTVVLVLSLILLFAYYDFIFEKRSGEGDNLMFAHNGYDSYTLQAIKWRDGQIAIIENDAENYDEQVQKYAYLELAIYEDNYYLSFPPFPAVPMLLLSFIFGYDTPSNFVSCLCGMLLFAFSFLLAKRFKVKDDTALILAMFVTVGSALFNLTFSGSVWFIAQSMAMCLTMASFYLVFSHRKWCVYLSMFLLALAVGCRPFQVFYFPFLIYVIFKKHNFKILRTWKYFIAPGVVAFAYMAYNYVRFHNIFEFGHNYLPEFASQKENGQFSLAYVKSNFQSLVKDMPEFTSEGFAFSKYGFCFYLSSVIFILLAGAVLYRICKDVSVKIQHKQRDCECDRLGIIIILMATLVHIFLVLMHGSPGGYQFGARYIADCVPAAMLCVLLCGKEFSERFKVPAAMLLTYGVVINYIGAISVIV